MNKRFGVKRVFMRIYLVTPTGDILATCETREQAQLIAACMNHLMTKGEDVPDELRRSGLMEHDQEAFPNPATRR